MYSDYYQSVILCIEFIIINKINKLNSTPVKIIVLFRTLICYSNLK